MKMTHMAGVALGTASLALSAFIGSAWPVASAGARSTADASAACPTVTPLHGLLPFLIWIGIFPRPVMASTVAASDTSTSLVIRPDPNDQITCGKTAIKTVENVVFSTRTLANGKSLDLLMDIQMPELPGKKPLVVYVTGGGFGGLPTASKF